MIIKSLGEIAFYIFSMPVYWYGIIMALAVLIGFLTAEKISDTDTKSFIINNSPIVIILGILGARLYYCLLNFSYYFKNPLEILNIRQGGLSIHGMIIAGIITLFCLTKKNKLNFLKTLDVFSCVLPLSQAIGRWGNFFNEEAFGIPVKSQNWGLYISQVHRPIEYINYELFHPTFLYESVLNLIIFVILINIFKKPHLEGYVFFYYLIFYSIVRLFTEQIRIDSALNVNDIPIAQIVSILLVIIGFLGLIFAKKHKPKITQ